MTDQKNAPEGRDYHRLLRVLDAALETLLDPATPATLDALRSTFEGAADAFGAERAALFSTHPELHVVASRGLSAEDVRAAEEGTSSPGVSSSVIREVVETRRPILVRDPRHERGPAARTRTLAGRPYSVLCAPVLDPSAPREDGGRPVGVLYFQNQAFASAFTDLDLAWITSYARALSWTLHALVQASRLRDLSERSGGPEIIGDSPAMTELRQEIHEVWIAAAEREMPDPLLLLGPTGSGKELVARYIHAYSCRARKPFLVLNCAEIDRSLAASRLFGHRRGAFTGADRDSPGIIRSAEGGVLLLDELGALSPDVQSQLLRVLDTHAVQGIGEVRETQVDVWIFLATSADLEAAVAARTFSPDLWERIKTQQVRVPALRDRPEDIRTLAVHFLAHHERLARRRTLGFDAGALHTLLQYSWPGNVRELSRLISTLVLRVPGGRPITREVIAHVAPHVCRDASGPGPRRAEATLRTLVDDFRRRLVLQTIHDLNGDVRKASQVLGVPWGTFSGYLQRYGLSKRRPRRSQTGPAPAEDRVDE